MCVCFCVRKMVRGKPNVRHISSVNPLLNERSELRNLIAQHIPAGMTPKEYIKNVLGPRMREQIAAMLPEPEDDRELETDYVYKAGKPSSKPAVILAKPHINIAKPPPRRIAPTLLAGLPAIAAPAFRPQPVLAIPSRFGTHEDTMDQFHEQLLHKYKDPHYKPTWFGGRPKAIKPKPLINSEDLVPIGDLMPINRMGRKWRRANKVSPEDLLPIGRLGRKGKRAKRRNLDLVPIVQLGRKWKRAHRKKRIHPDLLPITRMGEKWKRAHRRKRVDPDLLPINRMGRKWKRAQRKKATKK
jgi:hypothetical protein